MNDNFTDINQKMDLILTIGQLLAENSATADRIIRNSKRVAAFMQIPEENFHLQVMPSILFLTVIDGDKKFFASRNLTKHGVDMNLIIVISQFTWKTLKKNYSAKKFQDLLNNIIERKKFYTRLQTFLAPGIACGAFCVLFGGDFLAAIYAAFCAVLGKFFQLKLLKLGINDFIAIACAAFIAAAVAYFGNFLPIQTNWHPLMACALFLVPGVPIINATIDTLNGFLLDGLVKIFRIILITASTAVGIVIAIEICMEFVVFEFTEISLVPDHNIFILAVAASIAAMGFSVLFNMPKRCLPAIGILGALAVCTRNLFMFEFHFSQEIGSLISATLVSLAVIKVIKWTHSPMQVLIIPAIIPLIPGVLIYRFLTACVVIKELSVEEFFVELNCGIDAMQIIFAIAIGAALPNLIAKKIFEKKNKDAQEKLLNEIYMSNKDD